MYVLTPMSSSDAEMELLEELKSKVSAKDTISLLAPTLQAYRPTNKMHSFDTDFNRAIKGVLLWFVLSYNIL